MKFVKHQTGYEEISDETLKVLRGRLTMGLEFAFHGARKLATQSRTGHPPQISARVLVSQQLRPANGHCLRALKLVMIVGQYHFVDADLL